MTHSDTYPVDSSASESPFAATNVEYLAALRLQMMRYAELQLSDGASAEDAVQEAFIAAMKAVDRFQARAAFKTWVFAILRNKINDQLRARQRVEQREVLSDTEGTLEEFFDRSGHWQGAAAPSSWSNPQSATDSDDFWRVFQHCLDGMPAQQAQAFMMREMVQLESSEICAELAITPSNLNVLLHRGRLRLRDCLERCWFEEGA